MLKLHELQSKFIDNLLHDKSDSELQHLIFARCLTKTQALQIYRNNVFTHLCEALAAVYPVIQQVVGSGYFTYLAEIYSRSQPSRSGDLQAFGETFSDYLQHLPELKALPYLADLAHLEWAWHKAFHSAGAGTLNFQQLAAIAPDDYVGLRFQLHPSLSLLASNYAVVRIWEAHQQSTLPEHLSWQGEECALIYRPELQVQVMRIRLADYVLLSHLQKGAGLADATDAALAHETNYALNARLVEFVDKRMIVAFSKTSESTE